jgi:4-alpha-glucanotransferase
MTETGLFSDQKVELINGAIVDMSPANLDEDSIDELTERMVKVFSNRDRVRIEKAIDINDVYWLPHPDVVLAKCRRYGDNSLKLENIFLIIEASNTALAEDLGTIECLQKPKLAPLHLRLQSSVLLVHRFPSC